MDHEKFRDLKNSLYCIVQSHLEQLEDESGRDSALEELEAFNEVYLRGCDLDILCMLLNKADIRYYRTDYPAGDVSIVREDYEKESSMMFSGKGYLEDWR
jgi:hypothetical protein